MWRTSWEPWSRHPTHLSENLRELVLRALMRNYVSVRVRELKHLLQKNVVSRSTARGSRTCWANRLGPFELQRYHGLTLRSEKKGHQLPSVLLLMKGCATDQRLVMDEAALTSDFLRSRVLRQLSILIVNL